MWNIIVIQITVMKRSIYLPIFLLSFQTFAQRHAPYASISELASMKIFPSLMDIKWYTEGNLDKIVFYRDSTTINVFMNRNGSVTKVVRYYTDPNELPVFLLAKLTERFPDHTLTAVIEEHDQDNINYLVNISNSSGWMQVHTDISGKFTVLRKFTHPAYQADKHQMSTLP
jgi:hypothetical protein